MGSRLNPCWTPNVICLRVNCLEPISVYCCQLVR